MDALFNITQPDGPGDKQPERSANAQAELAAASQIGRSVAVAVAGNLWRTLDYLWDDSLGEPSLGQRVRVPLGASNRKTLAFVVGLEGSRGPAAGGSAAGAAAAGVAPITPVAVVPAAAGAAARRLKRVVEVIDAASQFDPVLWKLAGWISQYYLTPLGVTLAAMIPSAVGRHAPKTEAIAFLASDRHDWPGSLGLRQKKVLDELLEARKQGIEPIPLEQLRHHSGGSPDTIRRLVSKSLIRLETRPVVLPELTGQADGDPFALNDEQAAALANVEAKLSAGFSVTLLHGVTGSGKTEVYVRAIRRAIEMGRQAILLAPEIALATQTLQRLLKRLPRVAVLHSGLTDAQRAFYYQQVRDGHAAVVVGPRSAVFAPCRNLGLIVVDEEHEPTYKQDNAPRYHARDVAVMRAQMAGVPVLLGSATPSLESFHNVQQKRYDLLSLSHRVLSLPMPKLQIVHLRQEMQPSARVELLGSTLTKRMATALDRRQQIILLMNRRGYASYVFCPSCQWIMSCDHCTRAMVFHQATQLVVCHYCEHTMHLPEHCPACRKKLLLFGFGIQRIEGELARKFPTARLARMDSDTMTTPAQFQKLFDEFGRGDIDILLGTQMVAKGLDFPRVGLVGVVSADTSLTIPDFRAAERTFQLIVQVAGRAGRSEQGGEVIVQTLHADEPAIQAAINHDYDGFAAGELALRKEMQYPPYCRMVRFLLRHEKSERAQEAAEMLADVLRRALPPAEYRMVGPQAAGVLKINNQFRFEILLMVRRAGLVQQLLYPKMEEIARSVSAEIIADIDPMNLL